MYSFRTLYYTNTSIGTHYSMYHLFWYRFFTHFTFTAFKLHTITWTNYSEWIWKATIWYLSFMQSPFSHLYRTFPPLFCWLNSIKVSSCFNEELQFILTLVPASICFLGRNQFNAVKHSFHGSIKRHSDRATTLVAPVMLLPIRNCQIIKTLKHNLNNCSYLKWGEKQTGEKMY